MKEFLEKVLRSSGPFGKQRLLVWDSFRCHISQKTKVILKKLGLNTAVIPGGCTGFVQPPDVSWNKPFKGKIQEYYESWMDVGPKSYTDA